ncbi:transferrin receptor protein 1-like [Conger conger]|nr:transferrin receptor protein 1-like [Conger conger]XP_061093888.1 transferrin receptor protein 1-like [Conger conger]
MESTMGQARSAISKILCGEERSYTRFNLAQNMEGDNSQVEMKLSTDGDEEAPNSAAQNHAQNTYSRQPKRPSKNLAFIVIGIFLIFIIGFLIGYLTNYRQEADSDHCTPVTTEASTWEGPKEEVVPELDWSDIRSLLQDRLTAERFSSRLSDLSQSNHEAGSEGDELLANIVHQAFETYDMSPWNDEHFVKIQIPPSDSSNEVLFGEEQIGIPKGYLSYSATGTKEGRVVYVHYGELGDFENVTGTGIDLTGAVVLLRAGKISFAEKVANAAKLKAAAVLIYPDPADYTFEPSTELYGHVHLGSGDPYTPGFPSFNHTQFPPVKSSGLPEILAQTITANMAAKIVRKMGGLNAPSSWSEGSFVSMYKLGGENDTITVRVNNVLTERRIHNVFGAIKGFMDSDRYVVIGAQRDSWGPGYAKSTVGTSILLELAHAISDMVKNGDFRPRRSIVFASWSAGEYGSVGATEWLEGYLTSLGLKAFSYINLDGALTGHQTFKAAASPLLYKLVQNTMREMKSPIGEKPGEKSLYEQVAGSDWEQAVMVPMQQDDSAYPFLAFSGIPSVSFRFADLRGSGEYPYFGTVLDTKEKLDYATDHRTAQLAASAAQFAGQMALRLVHDHLLRLDVDRYVRHFRLFVAKVNRRVYQLKQSGGVSGTQMEALSVEWLKSAVGSYSRAATDLAVDIQNSDLSDVEMCRTINDRIMRVEANLLSPYVSPKDTPFRHIKFGSGSHTMEALLDHLNAIRERSPDSDTDLFRNQFALATWTIQSCANNLAGDVWAMNNEI